MMAGTEDTNNQVPTQAEVLRERQRFLNLVEKINKLEEAINTFEADHESIDSNVDWLSRLTTMRNEMEQAHKTFESSIEEKCAEHKTKIEQSLEGYNKFVNEKREEVQASVDELEQTKGDIQTASDEIQSKKSSVEAIAVECENDKKR